MIQSGRSHKATVHCGCARISVLTATTARILSVFVCAYACECTHHTCISREAEMSASSSKYQDSKMFYYTHTHTWENSLYWVLRSCQRSGMPPCCKHSQDSSSCPLHYNLVHTFLEMELGGKVWFAFSLKMWLFWLYLQLRALNNFTSKCYGRTREAD